LLHGLRAYVRVLWRSTQKVESCVIKSENSALIIIDDPRKDKPRIMRSNMTASRERKSLVTNPKKEPTVKMAAPSKNRRSDNIRTSDLPEKKSIDCR